jgi:21S rRNA (GM2251-2'-O)-methyltransferase
MQCLVFGGFRETADHVVAGCARVHVYFVWLVRVPLMEIHRVSAVTTKCEHQQGNHFPCHTAMNRLGRSRRRILLASSLLLSMGFVVVAGFHHIPLVAQQQRRRVPAVFLKMVGGRFSSSSDNSSWSDNPSSSSTPAPAPPPRFVGGWDDEDDLDYAKATQKKRSASGAKSKQRRGNGNNSFNRNNNNSFNRERGGGTKNFSRGGGSFRGNNNSYQQQQQQQQLDPNRINMKLLEDVAGFDHLYGIAPVLNALKAGRRDFFTPYENNNETRRANKRRSSERSDDDDDEENEYYDEENYNDDNGDDDDDTASPRRDDSSLRPEAQTRPCLFVQAESSSSSSSSESSSTTTMRSAEKAEAVAKALYLAENMKLPIAYVDKGILNTLSNNRPHQGLVLRCGKLKFETFRNFLDSPGLGRVDRNQNNFWLVLDQIVDPQNFGALIRTAEFLAVPSILVCAKNAAPPSAVVSAASAGALEGTNVRIYSTPSLPRALATAKAAGDSTIVGATSNLPMNYDAQLYELDEFPVDILRPPNEILRHATLLVLGSEGSGLRFSVAKSCTHFCRIPGGGVDASTTPGGGGGTVDSLNVSVSAGIFLWHFLRILKLQQPPATTDDDFPTLTTLAPTPSRKARKKF